VANWSDNVALFSPALITSALTWDGVTSLLQSVLSEDLKSKLSLDDEIISSPRSMDDEMLSSPRETLSLTAT
ncbi:hypothetical protein Tco_1350682, partial [Tanacetum coccineum]